MRQYLELLAGDVVDRELDLSRAAGLQLSRRLGDEPPPSTASGSRITTVSPARAQSLTGSTSPPAAMHTPQYSLPGSDPPAPRQVTVFDEPAASPPGVREARRTHSASGSSYRLQKDTVDEPTNSAPVLPTDPCTRTRSPTSTTTGDTDTDPGDTVRSTPVTVGGSGRW